VITQPTMMNIVLQEQNRNEQGEKSCLVSQCCLLFTAAKSMMNEYGWAAMMMVVSLLSHLCRDNKW